MEHHIGPRPGHNKLPGKLKEEKQVFSKYGYVNFGNYYNAEIKKTNGFFLEND